MYGYAGGDPINFSDPFGLCIPWPACLFAAAGGGAIAAGGIGSSGVAAATIAAAGQVAAPAMVGGLGFVLLQPAFPGDGELISGSTTGTFAAEATAVYNRREGAQIRAAIKSVTGQNATSSQYNCMSQFIHECKESGDGGSKNEKGDFTWEELLQIARDLFGKKPQ